MCYSLDTSGAAARRQRLRHVFPKTLTRIRADQHGAERGFALTRLAKSSLIRHAVAGVLPRYLRWFLVGSS